MRRVAAGCSRKRRQTGRLYLETRGRQWRPPRSESRAVRLVHVTHATDTRRGPEPPDLSEKGGNRNGQPQRSDERLFMQFLAFGGCLDVRPLAEALRQSGLDAALYEDVNDPRGVGLIAASVDPSLFVGPLRALLNAPPFASLAQKPEYTMLGRTYSLGYEPDLKESLLDRPRRTILNPAWGWAVY